MCIYGDNFETCKRLIWCEMCPMELNLYPVLRVGHLIVVEKSRKVAAADKLC